MEAAAVCTPAPPPAAATSTLCASLSDSASESGLSSVKSEVRVESKPKLSCAEEPGLSAFLPAAPPPSDAASAAGIEIEAPGVAESRLLSSSGFIATTRRLPPNGSSTEASRRLRRESALISPSSNRRISQDAVAAAVCAFASFSGDESSPQATPNSNPNSNSTSASTTRVCSEGGGPKSPEEEGVERTLLFKTQTQLPCMHSPPRRSRAAARRVSPEDSAEERALLSCCNTVQVSQHPVCQQAAAPRRAEAEALERRRREREEEAKLSLSSCNSSLSASAAAVAAVPPPRPSLSRRPGKLSSVDEASLSEGGASSAPRCTNPIRRTSQLPASATNKPSAAAVAHAFSSSSSRGRFQEGGCGGACFSREVCWGRGLYAESEGGASHPCSLMGAAPESSASGSAMSAQTRAGGSASLSLAAALSPPSVCPLSTAPSSTESEICAEEGLMGLALPAPAAAPPSEALSPPCLLQGNALPLRSPRVLHATLQALRVHLTKVVGAVCRGRQTPNSVLTSQEGMENSQTSTVAPESSSVAAPEVHAKNAGKHRASRRSPLAAREEPQHSPAQERHSEVFACVSAGEEAMKTKAERNNSSSAPDVRPLRRGGWNGGTEEETGRAEAAEGVSSQQDDAVVSEQTNEVPAVSLSEGSRNGSLSEGGVVVDLPQTTTPAAASLGGSLSLRGETLLCAEAATLRSSTGESVDDGVAFPAKPSGDSEREGGDVVSEEAVKAALTSHSQVRADGDGGRGGAGDSMDLSLMKCREAETGAPAVVVAGQERRRLSSLQSSVEETGENLEASTVGECSESNSPYSTIAFHAAVLRSCALLELSEYVIVLSPFLGMAFSEIAAQDASLLQYVRLQLQFLRSKRQLELKREASAQALRECWDSPSPDSHSHSHSHPHPQSHPHSLGMALAPVAATPSALSSEQPTENACPCEVEVLRPSKTRLCGFPSAEVASLDATNDAAASQTAVPRRSAAGAAAPSVGGGGGLLAFPSCSVQWFSSDFPPNAAASLQQRPSPPPSASVSAGPSTAAPSSTARRAESPSQTAPPPSSPESDGPAAALSKEAPPRALAGCTYGGARWSLASASETLTHFGDTRVGPPPSGFMQQSGALMGQEGSGEGASSGMIGRQPLSPPEEAATQHSSRGNPAAPEWLLREGPSGVVVEAPSAFRFEGTTAAGGEASALAAAEGAEREAVFAAGARLASTSHPAAAAREKARFCGGLGEAEEEDLGAVVAREALRRVQRGNVQVTFDGQHGAWFVFCAAGVGESKAFSVATFGLEGAKRLAQHYATQCRRQCSGKRAALKAAKAAAAGEAAGEGECLRSGGRSSKDSAKRQNHSVLPLPRVTIGLCGPPGGLFNLARPPHPSCVIPKSDFSASRVARLSRRAMELPYVHGVRFEACNFAWVAHMRGEVRRFLVKKHGFEKSRLCAVEKIEHWRATLPEEALRQELKAEQEVLAMAPASLAEMHQQVVVSPASSFASLEESLLRRMGGFCNPPRDPAALLKRPPRCRNVMLDAEGGRLVASTQDHLFTSSMPLLPSHSSAADPNHAAAAAPPDALSVELQVSAQTAQEEDATSGSVACLRSSSHSRVSTARNGAAASGIPLSEISASRLLPPKEESAGVEEAVGGSETRAPSSAKTTTGRVPVSRASEFERRAEDARGGGAVMEMQRSSHANPEREGLAQPPPQRSAAQSAPFFRVTAGGGSLC